MVNLRKIGAIASGALFLGATFGTAIAATVPAAFQKTMLADAGVAKAQLIVGANAPGIDADTASAKVIQDAVKTKLAVSGAQGDIKFSYYSDDLDHDDHTWNWNDAGYESDDNFTRMYYPQMNGTVNDTVADRLYIGDIADRYFGINGTAGLKFDQNEDGDLKDADDYTLYTGLYIMDGVSAAQVRLAYYSTNVVDIIGTRQKIKGSWWLVTDADYDSDYIKMGPAIYRNLAVNYEALTSKATTFVGNIKMVLVGGSSTNTTCASSAGCTLSIYNGDSLEGSVALSTASESVNASRAYVGGTDNAAQYGGGFYSARVPSSKITTKVHDNSDVLDNYEVFLTKGNETSNTVEVTITETSQISKIQNKQENVLGYSKVYVGDNDLIGGNDRDAMYLMSDLYTLSMDSDKDVQGTYFNLKFRTGKTIDLRRSDSETVSSGTKMDATWSDYSPFLDVDIKPTALAGNKIEIQYNDNDLDDDTNNDVIDNYFAANVVTDGSSTVTIGTVSNTSNLNSITYGVVSEGFPGGATTWVTIHNSTGYVLSSGTLSGDSRLSVTINVSNTTSYLNISAASFVLNGTPTTTGTLTATVQGNASGKVTGSLVGQVTNYSISSFSISAAAVTGSLGNRYDISGVSDTYVNVLGNLKIDQNEDGDLKDADDYVRYTGLYVLDGAVDAQVRPAYYATNITDLTGTRQKINGKWYLVTDADPNSDYIKMGPAIYKNLAAQTEALKTKATTFVGDSMMLLLADNATSGLCTTTCSLVVYKGDAQESAIALNTANEATPGGNARARLYGGYFVDSKTPSSKISTKVHDVTDAFDNYEIFITKGNETSSTIEVAVAEISQISKIQNKQDNVLGYSKAYVGDGDILQRGDTDALLLMGDLYTIGKDSDKDITGTYFNAKFRTDKTIDMRRVDKVTVESGAMMDYTLSDYNPFLKTDTKATSTGGVAATPTLDIINEVNASKNTMNLALVGGPVANTLTAELVTGKKSAITWETSDGDIEVVSNAFATGKYAVIVAGKDRGATAAAAKALADAL